jgi:hypothetical protein
MIFLKSIFVQLFVDDTQLYPPVPLSEAGLMRAIHCVKDCIDDIKKGMTLNELDVNEDKTAVLLILPSHQIHKFFFDCSNLCDMPWCSL